MHPIVALTLLGSAQAATLTYFEGEPGMPHFAADYQNPNRLSVTGCSLEIAGFVERDSPDFFTLLLPPDKRLTEVTLLRYGHRSRANVSFIGFQEGDTLDDSPENARSEDFTFALFGADDLDQPLLSSPAGISGPLAFWLNETASSGAAYRLRFTIVPEPFSTTLCGLSFLFTLKRRRQYS